MDCFNCGGSGCELCLDGKIEITQCPLELITDDIWDAIRFAELYEKGLPPVLGGALDQANIFIGAARFIFGEKNYWKRKLGIN